jgi:uncharacterized protein with FMN-binding domain
MRRAPFVIAGTAAGLGLILSFHTKPVTVNLGTSPQSSNAKNTSNKSVGTGSPPSTSGEKTKSTSSTTSSSASSTQAKESSIRSATGDTVNYYYGAVAVKVSATGSRLTNVTIASLSDDGNFRSVSIDEAAIPTLEQEALSAQSAKIQAVSGATYTSAGFTRSLQSALKKLGL